MGKRGTSVECAAVPGRLAIRWLFIRGGVVLLVHLKAVSCFQDLLLVLAMATEDPGLLAFAFLMQPGLLMNIMIPAKMVHSSTVQSTKQLARVYHLFEVSTINPFLALSAKLEEAQQL